MDGRNLVESLFRWIHVVAGILWIGQLWFFNWVNSNFAPTMDAETKKKVVPELMPRALYLFRWGAAWTWVTGLLLLGLVYHATGLQFADPGTKNSMAGGILTLVALLTFAVYDPLVKAISKPEAQAAVGLVAVAVLVWAFVALGGFGWRGTAIHLGATFGTIMAATKNGEKPDPALVAQAGLRSKHNTYLSVPLVFMMLAQHATWAAGYV